MKKNLKGKILNIVEIAKEIFEIKIESELSEISAGQFFQVLCPPKTMRRPFGAAGFEAGVLKGIFKLRGDGTKYLSSLKAGDAVNFTAPLGNGFNIENKKSLIIGAGVGVAPLLYLRETLSANNIENYFIAGFKSEEDEIKGADFAQYGGTILDFVEPYIEKFAPEKIYACAPDIVLKKISEIASKHGIKCEVALEKTMACGIGVCKGCVIRIVKDGVIQNATICHDGPVFNASEVVWE